MALADKYMSDEHLQTYMTCHYQLIIVTCLSITMKLDSLTEAPSHKTFSEICQGAYTPEEIESEEMCILQALEWRVHPPTASQVANHILALVNDSTGAGCDWEPFVDRVHQLIDTSVVDLDLSMLRPSTVAIAAILVTTNTLDGQDIRQRILCSTLSVMSTLDFDSPFEFDIFEIDSIQTNTEPSQDRRPQTMDELLLSSGLYGQRESEGEVESESLPRDLLANRKRSGDFNRSNGSVERIDDMELGDSRSVRHRGHCQSQGPYASMEESHLLRSSPICSSSTLETISEA